MPDRRSRLPLAALLVLVLTACAAPEPAPRPGPDLATTPTLYVVGYAHLDTQWRWDYAQTIDEFLPKTMHDNFALFAKYPHYVFNFSGANRYRLMKEYYPADYAKVKEYVAAGRWFPAGSAMEESDVNSPSAESLFRQILYGTQFFRREFGRTSAEYMLPDCFGFPASLPSILAHAGLKGFSTQKLTWHSAAQVGGEDSPEQTPEGVPFNVGFWEGPDGHGVVAALNAGDYTGDIYDDLSKPPPPMKDDVRYPPVDWVARVARDGEASGLKTDYHYFGTGDTGGAPREASVRLLEAIVTKGETVPPARPAPGQRREDVPPPSGPAVRVGDGPLHVVSSTAEQMFLDIAPDQTSKLPRYKGDLLLIEHSAGSLTSQAYMKRWNRQNEVLAGAAEHASVAAAWLGGRPYPRARLNAAWTLVMGGQFHDILPGTSIPKAYEYSWNDEVLAMNQFADIAASASASVASVLDTRAEGTPVVVYNPLDVAREDVVEATVLFAGGAPKAVRVVGPDGKDVPAQIDGDTVVFLARVPSVGYAVFDVRPADAPAEAGPLAVTTSSIENARYRIAIDRHGDIASLFDKTLGKELLAAPARLAITTDRPVDWPAWNIDWADAKKPPRAYVGGPATVRIVERGPARVALEVSRTAEGSTFVQTIRLAAGGAGDRVEIANVIDWRTKAANLKAAFPLTASNPLATYNWDVGTIQRGNDNERKYEVPSHQWVDLTDAGGGYGVTVLTDCKNGSDKPDDRTLRLTLLRTPGIGTGNGKYYSDQATQDWGRHTFVYGLAAHAGDWREGRTNRQALRLNEPLMAFVAAPHDGPLGRTFSLVSISSPQVRLLALKKAEESDEIVVRLVETDGKPAMPVHVSFGAPIRSVREVDAAERTIRGPAESGGIRVDDLVTTFRPYELHTFAVTLGTPPATAMAPTYGAVTLPYDRTVSTADGATTPEGFAGWAPACRPRCCRRRSRTRASPSRCRRRRAARPTRSSRAGRRSRCPTASGTACTSWPPPPAATGA